MEVQEASGEGRATSSIFRWELLTQHPHFFLLAEKFVIPSIHQLLFFLWSVSQCALHRLGGQLRYRLSPVLLCALQLVGRALNSSTTRGFWMPFDAKKQQLRSPSCPISKCQVQPLSASRCSSDLVLSVASQVSFYKSSGRVSSVGLTKAC